MTFADLIVLLQRRLIAAPSSSAQATKTGAAETIIKSLFTQQVITDRTFGGVTVGGWQAYLTCEVDGGRRQTESASNACRTCSRSCQAVAQASASDGTYMAFDFEVQGPLAYEFCVYDQQRGVDRSATSPIPLVISDAAGKLSSYNYSEDYSSCASAVFASGQSVGGSQLMEYVASTALENMGPFAHTEKYGLGISTSDPNALVTQARAILRDSRPLVELLGAILETENAIMGRDWDYGDRLTVSVQGIELPAYIEVMSVTVDTSGQESINVTTRGELVDPVTGAFVDI